MEWWKDIEVDKLPQLHREVVELIGLENTVKLIERFAKQPLYFPGMDKFVSEKKKGYIIRHFTGDNHRELARITGYSLVWVYEIIKEQKTLSKIKQKVLFQL